MTALPSTRLLFLLVLTVLAAAYTVMAFGMEWRVASGQIGPGFFPRLVGVATVVGCLVAIARGPRKDDEPGGGVGVDGRARTDARVTFLVVVLLVLFYVVFEVLGAVLSSVLFLGIMLSVVNRGNRLVNAAVSVLVPAVLYVLFELLLDAGLPEGLVLPL